MKERPQKIHKRYQKLSQEEKEKGINMVTKDTKMSLNMKNKGWFSVEKVMLKCIKMYKNSNSKRFS